MVPRSPRPGASPTASWSCATSATTPSWCALPGSPALVSENVDPYAHVTSAWFPLILAYVGTHAEIIGP